MKIIKIRARQRDRQREGFTLIDLIAVLAVLTALLVLPTLSRAKERAQQVVCKNNCKQLMLAWHMYFSDYGDLLVGSDGQWVGGSLMDSCPQCLLTSPIINGPIFPYVNNLNPWHCPADVSTGYKTAVYPWGGPGTNRVRSESMNLWMDGPSTALNPGGSPLVTVFNKYTDIKSVSEMWVICDENPGSINDGALWTQIPSSTWLDVPASYHNNAGVLGFADGHVESHEFHDKAILGMAIKSDNNDSGLQLAPQDGGVDLTWMQQHSTIPANP